MIESLLLAESLRSKLAWYAPTILAVDSFIDQIRIDLSLEPVTNRSSSWLNAQHDTYREWPETGKNVSVLILKR